MVEQFSHPGDVVYDPFCGAGTIPFEAWAAGRQVIANDLNPYASLLTRAKLFPPVDQIALFDQLEKFGDQVLERASSCHIDDAPDWVKVFFHPQTFIEIQAWVALLRENESWFLLSCLMGILHHQRPGFLSYPSSHTVPYLRLNKFPQNEFPDLYQYRNVKERLRKKVIRALKRQPLLDPTLYRTCFEQDASLLVPPRTVDAIITSPPYMRQLEYGRDNRLRLWFLGVPDHKELDSKISPREFNFLRIIRDCLFQWDQVLREGGKCVLFLGDNYSWKFKQSLPDVINHLLSSEMGNYRLLFRHESLIPTSRRVRRNYSGNKSETVLAFEKTSRGIKDK